MIIIIISTILFKKCISVYLIFVHVNFDFDINLRESDDIGFTAFF